MQRLPFVVFGRDPKMSIAIVFLLNFEEQFLVIGLELFARFFNYKLHMPEHSVVYP